MDKNDYYQTLARQLIREVRGRRSQSDLSRRAGYKSNMVQRWEAGECFPHVETFFALCKRQRIDVSTALARFYGRAPDWLANADPTSNDAAAALLRDQKGRVTLGELARRSGYNRYTLARWLEGKARPRLHEFLHVLDVSSRRLLDFIATLVDPARIAILEEAWSRLTRAKDAAYRLPWSQAVLRALELKEYRRSGWKQPGWLAKQLGIERSQVDEALQALEASGQVRQRSGRWQVREIVSINTGGDPMRARQLKASWADEATARLRKGDPGLFGYTVFAASRQDMLRLRRLQLEFVQAMEAVLATSTASECVGLYCVQLLDLDAGPRNALLPPETAESRYDTP